MPSAAYLQPPPPALVRSSDSLGFGDAALPAVATIHTNRTSPRQRGEPVMWIPQTHWSVLDAAGITDSADRILHSQFEIASYLRRNAGALVLHEGIASSLFHAKGTIMHALPPFISHDRDSREELALDLLRHRSSQALALKLFPQGLPSTVGALNPAQQRFIVEHGGAFTLLYLGVLTEIGPTSTPAVERKVSRTLQHIARAAHHGDAEAAWRDHETQRLAFDERERQSSGR